MKNAYDIVVIGSGIAMSGPPPADPSAVSGEHGEGGKSEGGEGEEEHEEASAIGALIIAPAYSDGGG